MHTGPGELSNDRSGEFKTILNGCLKCASYTVVVINHLQTLTGGVTLTPFYYYIDFSKLMSQNII